MIWIECITWLLEGQNWNLPGIEEKEDLFWRYFYCWTNVILLSVDVDFVAHFLLQLWRHNLHMLINFKFYGFLLYKFRYWINVLIICCCLINLIFGISVSVWKLAIMFGVDVLCELLIQWRKILKFHTILLFFVNYTCSMGVYQFRC